jgi:hypothetical protein
MNRNLENIEWKYIIPLHKQSPKQKDIHLKKMQSYNKLIMRYYSDHKLPLYPTVRQLQPTDLGLNSWNINMDISGNWIQYTVQSRTLIIIDGIMLQGNTSNVNRITMKMGNTGSLRLGVLSTEELRNVQTILSRLNAGGNNFHLFYEYNIPELKPEGDFSIPFVYEEFQGVYIDVGLSQPTKDDYVVLKGWIIEPIGMTTI